MTTATTAAATPFRDVLDRLGKRESLDEQAASDTMGTIMDGQATPAMIGGFLMALRAKGESVSEIVGCARAIRSRAAPFPADRSDLVDTCGTGGDGSGTFNISTTAAIIAAGAGAMVAKHGNRAISSRTGSADVLEALGVDISMGGVEAAEALAAARVTFLFAPAYHSAMRHVAPVRRELGVRTVFNLLGPLCNPAGAAAQLIGVFDRALVRPVAEAAASLGLRRAMVVHGRDGLDEITVTGPTFVAEFDGVGIREYELDPRELGMAIHDGVLLRGGDAPANAGILRQVLTPDSARTPSLSACRDVAVLNAGAALYVAGRAPSLPDGIAQAREAVADGSALAALERLTGVCSRIAARRARKVVPTAVPAMSAGWGR